MKKLFVGSLFLLISYSILATDNINVEDIRKGYYEAVYDSKRTDELYSQLKKVKSSDPLVQAYIGSLEALKAKHARNPYYKLSYLAQFDKTIRAAVKKAPDNLEIRFLRFSVQYYVPEFLGYSKEMQEDKQKIVYLITQKKYSEDERGLVKKVYHFMVETKSLTTSEINQMKRGLN